jgi:molybdenum cofactor cytidylyltransferase
MNHADTASEPSRLGVIILGAGASSRMGQPKLLLPWNGTTIIGHLIRQWQALDAAQITVVCRPDDEPISAELVRLGFPRKNRIVNPEPERGMFSSIQCAAHWPGWQPGLTSWAIVLGDQPHLHYETLRNLVAFHARHSIAICQPSHEGHAGHPVLLPRSAFELLKNTDAQTLKTFLKQNDASIVKCPVTDPGLALDLDTPEDYKRLTSKTPVT